MNLGPPPPGSTLAGRQLGGIGSSYLGPPPAGSTINSSALSGLRAPERELSPPRRTLSPPRRVSSATRAVVSPPRTVSPPRQAVSPQRAALGQPDSEAWKRTDLERTGVQLDQKEAELRQNQFKYIREQTSTFQKDIRDLKQDVAGLKQEITASHGDLNLNVDGHYKELRDLMTRDRKERDNVQATHANKLASLERDLPNHKEDLQSLRDHYSSLESNILPELTEIKSSIAREREEKSAALLRLERKVNELSGSPGKATQVTLSSEVERRLAQQKAEFEAEREASQRELKETIAKQADALAKVQHILNQERSLREHRSGTVSERLDKLEKGLHPQVGANLSVVEADIRELKDHLNNIQVENQKVDGRVTSCERHAGLLTDVKKAHATLASDKGALAGNVSFLQDRMAQVEKMVEASLDKQNQSLTALNSRVSSCERVGSAHGDLQKSHAGLTSYTKALDADRESVKERIEYVERLLGDSFDKHAKELEALKQSHAKLEADTKTHHGKVNDFISQHKEKRDVHHLTVQERLDYLEGQMGAAAAKHDTHAQAFETQKADHTKMARDVKAHELHHQSTNERLSLVESALRDHKDKHGNELANAQKKLDHFQGRMTEERTVREANAASLDTLKKEQSRISNELRSLSQQHANEKERLTSVEKVFSDHADKHSYDLDAVKAAHQKLMHDAKGHDAKHAMTADKLENLTREKDDVHAHHASMKERVEYLERVLGDSLEGQQRELQSLKNAHQAHAKELDSVRRGSGKHDTLAERMDYVEALLGNTHDKHGTDFKSLFQKVDYIEKMVADSSRKQAREMDHFAQEHRRMWDAIDNLAHPSDGGRRAVSPVAAGDTFGSTRTMQMGTAALESPHRDHFAWPHRAGGAGGQSPAPAGIMQPQANSSGWQFNASAQPTQQPSLQPSLISRPLSPPQSRPQSPTAQAATRGGTQGVFESVDANHDGVLSREEFMKAKAMTAQQGSMAPQQQLAPQPVSGHMQLAPQQVLQPQSQPHSYVPQPQPQAHSYVLSAPKGIFDTVDANHDGVLSREEFMKAKAMAQQGSMAPQQQLAPQAMTQVAPPSPVQYAPPAAMPQMVPQQAMQQVTSHGMPPQQAGRVTSTSPPVAARTDLLPVGTQFAVPSGACSPSIPVHGSPPAGYPGGAPTTIWPSGAKPAVQSGGPVQTAGDAFNQFDTDHNGVLSRDEFNRMMMMGKN